MPHHTHKEGIAICDSVHFWDSKYKHMQLGIAIMLEQNFPWIAE